MAEYWQKERTQLTAQIPDENSSGFVLAGGMSPFFSPSLPEENNPENIICESELRTIPPGYLASLLSPFEQMFAVKHVLGAQKEVKMSLWGK